MKAPELVRHVARAVAAAGGRAWVVGGSVRDALLGRPGKDWDLEVHGLSAEDLQRALARFRASPPVGQSFAVFKVRGSDLEVDVAVLGGGPAGCAAALSLRALRPELSVLLVEATSYGATPVSNTRLA
jgi:NADPH-dependent 2,4-dienoyl-CoA reductase/sulfur reductase-like enzyme